MKKRKKILSMLLVGALSISLFATTVNAEGISPDAENKTITEEDVLGAGKDSGDTLTIYCWNDEWQYRVINFMPGYTQDSPSDPNHGHIGTLPVEWIVTPSSDGVYLKKLDLDLADNTKDIDIFLVEADYAGKYLLPGIAKPLSEIGITASDTANQYEYTKQIGSNNGVQYATTWQTCCGGMIYNRDIAKQVLGTDDPVKVQAAVSDWNKFMDVANKMKAAGFKMTPTAYTDYRVFANNTSNPWVSNGKINIDSSIMFWADMSKQMVDSGQTGTFGLWDTNEDFQKNISFCVFGPSWYYNFCMLAGSGTSIADRGGWAICQGPQAHFWGGSWICVADKSDNQSAAANMIKSMTMDESVLTSIAEKCYDDVNHKKVINKCATEARYQNSVLGGQNPYTIFKDTLNKIDGSHTTIYDQTCNEEFQVAMSDYFIGRLSKEVALNNFFTSVTSTFPELSKGSVPEFTTVTLDKTSAIMYSGEELTLTATVKAASGVSKKVTWSVNDSKIGSVNNGVVKAKKPGKLTVYARTADGGFAQCDISILCDDNPDNPFADIKYESGWKYNAAESALKAGYMNGMGSVEGRILFSPDTPINRSQFVQTIFNMEFEKGVDEGQIPYVDKFSDVPQGKWFTNAISWAAGNNIVTGKGDRFDVNGKATREQLACMLYNYAKYKGLDTSIKENPDKNFDDFPDKDDVSSWAVTAVKWALSQGIMSGTGAGKISPKANATRVECAVMLLHFTNIPKSAPGLKEVPEEALLENEVPETEKYEIEPVKPEAEETIKGETVEKPETEETVSDEIASEEISETENESEEVKETAEETEIEETEIEQTEETVSD